MRYTFAPHLARYGPGRYRLPMTLSRARMYCERLALNHYENFLVGSILLPRTLRPHFFAIYSFCRWADDLSDETGSPRKALELLEWWEVELQDCFRGSATHPVMIALADTVEQRHLPIEPFQDLIHAFKLDQIQRRYRNFEQVRDYCRGSADPVGRLLLYLFGCFDQRNAELSDRICTALQLANFCQDISRDLELNRIYLPMDECLRFGVREEDLFGRRCTGQFQDLMAFQVERARDLIYRGLPLVENVPPAVRVDVELFARGGLAILDRIERAHYDVLTRRPKVSKWAQMHLLVDAGMRRYLGRRL